MAYGRRRSTYRRKSRRGRRTLSTRSIFSNKSSRAQASQIYALRKSVRRVQRQCRPEVKTIKTSVNGFGLALSDTATPGTVNHFRTYFPVVPQGNTDDTRIGNKITILNPTLFCGLQYVEQKNSAMSYYDSTLNNHGIQVRLIAVQSKVAGNTIPVLEDILSSVTYGSQQDSMMMMRQPFKTGVTSSYNILMDRRVTLNSDSPTKSYRIRIRPKSRSMVWESGLTYPKGSIFLFALQGGASFHRFEQAEDYAYDWNKIDFTYRLELAYTDA